MQIGRRIIVNFCRAAARTGLFLQMPCLGTAGNPLKLNNLPFSFLQVSVSLQIDYVARKVIANFLFLSCLAKPEVECDRFEPENSSYIFLRNRIYISALSPISFPNKCFYGFRNITFLHIVLLR